MRKAKVAKKKTRSQLGRMSRQKGAQFERQLADDMRSIYDSPELVEQLIKAKADKDLKEHRRLLKSSNVRRSDQGKGAKEPDLVIKGCVCWFELQHTGSANFNPLKKLEQAERDVRESGSSLWPVSICKCTGSSKITVCTRFWTFLLLADLLPPNNFPDFKANLEIYFSYDHLLKLLRARHG